MTTFADLDLSAPLLRALEAQGYTEPTPIQLQAIPLLLDGRDVLGCAQTGTGKTAAFCLPILQDIDDYPRPAGKPMIRALVLTPTRELASQIGASIGNYGQFIDVRYHVIFGGVKENPQIRALRAGIDVLVATPGRLLDLMGRGYISFDELEFFVLDEADRMLDMGFVHDVRRVLEKLPSDRQNLLFSATMPSAIVKLASSFLHDPVSIEVSPESTTVELIDQHVMFCTQADKRRLLAHLVVSKRVERAIVFTRTKHGANRLAKHLDRDGISAGVIHGNKSQNAREKALAGFKDGSHSLLIATDIAARGIDVDGIDYVFNFDLPNISESYVHRIGRTARAGRSGTAIAFCDETEGQYLREIEDLIGQKIPRVLDQPFHSEEAVTAIPFPAPKRHGRGGGGGGRGRHSGGGRGGRSASGGGRRRQGQSQGRSGTGGGRGRGSSTGGASASSKSGGRSGGGGKPGGGGSRTGRSATGDSSASGNGRRRRRRRGGGAGGGGGGGGGGPRGGGGR